MTERLTLDEYEIEAMGTAIYPDVGSNLTYPALGLAGEVGELVEHVKKLHRKGITRIVDCGPANREAMVDELGDVLWYVAAMARELQVDLNRVAQRNLRKLRERHR